MQSHILIKTWLQGDQFDSLGFKAGGALISASAILLYRGF